jgi:hypothetical protein
MTPITAKSIRHNPNRTRGIMGIGDNWKSLKEAALAKFDTMQLRQETRNNFYHLTLEITILLQNDFAKTVSKDQLSISSKKRLDTHSNSRYDFTLQDINQVLQDLFESYEDNEHAFALCQICTHKDETTSYTNITNTLKQLLHKLGITKSDKSINQDLACTRTALGNGHSTYFEGHQSVYFHQSINVDGAPDDEKYDYEYSMTNSVHVQGLMVEGTYGHGIFVPMSHAKSAYCRDLFQLHTVNKFINVIKTLDTLLSSENELLPELLDKAQELKQSLMLLENSKTTENIASSSWEPLINGESLSELIANSIDTNDLGIQNLIYLAYIKTQWEALNKYIERSVTIPLLDGRAEFISAIKLATLKSKPQAIEPSIVRDATDLLDKFGAILHKKRPINLYQHSMSVQIKIPIEDQKLEMDEQNVASSVCINLNNVIRLGTLQSVDAAIVYIKIMFEIAQQTSFRHNGTVYIIDNRILLDIDPTDNIHEAPLLEQHRQYIASALSQLRQEDYFGDLSVELIHLNFQDKDLALAMPDQVHQDNMHKLYDIVCDTLESKGQNFQINNNTPIEDKLRLEKFIYCCALFVEKYKNKGYYIGANSLNLAFLVQYISRSLGIPFSEGCKSNKDRGSMKKIRDEVFFTKIALLENYNLSFEEFFTITEHERDSFAQIVASYNTSAHITSLNTGVAGNKAVNSHQDFLKQVGLSPYSLTGPEEIMKKVKS